MVHKGKRKAVASSPSLSTNCHKRAASKKIPSSSDYKHDKVLKVKEKFPSLVDIENEGKEGKEKGQDNMEEELNVGAGVEGTAEGIQKLPDGFYEVEAIRGKKYHKGQPQYLIKWRDYPETNNTWEPYENIKYCTDMLETFEQSSQKHCHKRSNVLPKKKCSMQTKDGSDGTTACKFTEDSSSLYKGEGKVKGKHKLVEDFYEDKAIRKKLYHNDQPQYLIKRHEYLVNNSTSGSYDNNISCADLLEALNQSSWKCKRKRDNALSKKKHSAQTKDGRDDTNQKGGDDSSPLTSSSTRGRERGTSSGTTCSIKKDIIVYKRRQTCTADKDIIVYQQRHRLSIDNLDKKGKYIMKDRTEKEKATQEEPTTNKIPGPLPDVKKGVEGMINEGGKNFIMQDYVQKQREREEAKSGVGSTYFSIFFPNYKENTEENREAPPLPPFVRTMPDFHSPPQRQARKACARLTGAKRRKSGHVRRFIHPEGEAKKAMNAEVVDSTETIATPAAVDTATSNYNEKATDKVQGSKVALRSKPI